MCFHFSKRKATHNNFAPTHSRDNPEKLLMFIGFFVPSFFWCFWTKQQAPNPPEFAQPGLSRSNGGHPHREGTNLGLSVPVRLELPRCDAANLGVFDLSGRFGAR